MADTISQDEETNSLMRNMEAEASAAATVETAGEPALSGEPPPPYVANYGSSDAVPPTYEQAQLPAEPPPSYESVFGQVRAAKQESNGVVEFFKKLFIIILGTVGCTICVGMMLAIPVAMIVIGGQYLKDCPIEKYIPIYLIVGGSFGVLKNLSNIAQRIRNKQNEENDENAKTNPFDGTLNCFLFAWFIAGNVWIYRAYKSVDTGDPHSDDYCHPTLYWFAFWVTTSTYIVMMLTCCCICCAGVFAGLTNPAQQPNNASNP